MSDQPIEVQLGHYDKLEILRDEQESLAKHRKAVESTIRDVKAEVERQKYLQSLSAYYRTLQPPEGVARLKQLEELRASIIQAEQAVTAAYADVEKQAGGAAAAAPAQQSGAAGDFESFRRNRQ